jgi:hypothetical protein
MSMSYLSRWPRVTAIALVTIACVLGPTGCRGDGASAVDDDKGGSPQLDKTADTGRAKRERDKAFAMARVWAPPVIPIGQANLRDNPPGPGAFRADEEVSCTFKIEKIGGTTPKFYCELANGDVLKIKYGSGNAELQSEVAATRLLASLGFATDRMYVVKGVRCAGCPPYPFTALKCFQETGLKSVCFPGGLDSSSHTYFDTVVIERRIDGRKIEGSNDEGWSWYELDKIDPSRGGSSRAEVDALRLMAVFLAHWDNKGENQRLICPAGAELSNGECGRPVAVIQDLGATFGPNRVDLTNWRQLKVWKDAKSCTVSMKGLPFDGATFVERRISEAGRKHLLGLLEQLSDGQLRDLFDGSRFTSYDQVNAAARGIDAWVNAFKDKVSQIRSAGPCA